MMAARKPYKEIESADMMSEGRRIYRHTAFQDIDFHSVPRLVEDVEFKDCCFLGCKIPGSMQKHLSPDCLVFPDIDMPYKPFVARLYTPEDLYSGFDPSRPSSLKETFDAIVYDDYIEKGKSSDCIKETLCRSMHDFSMSDALGDFLGDFDPRKIVAIMGGHSMLRTGADYRTVAVIAKGLTEKGRLMVSGGGPGAMEATHFGAWMAGRSEEELSQALDILAKAPSFRNEGWLSTAFEVKEKFPLLGNTPSLGIPTWLYGHEPSTPFATHIAKFFDNSVRENHIISIPQGGIIFSPGSAGTVREIFQDAEQNHYGTPDCSSPMVFLGKDYYTRQIPIHPLLQHLSETGRFQNMHLSITDDSAEAVRSILEQY